MKIGDEYREFESSDLGETPRWALSLQLGQIFILHHSAFIIALRREKVLSESGLQIIRFKNDEVIRSLLVVVGKIKEAILL